MATPLQREKWLHFALFVWFFSNFPRSISLTLKAPLSLFFSPLLLYLVSYKLQILYHVRFYTWSDSWLTSQEESKPKKNNDVYFVCMALLSGPESDLEHIHLSVALPPCPSPWSAQLDSPPWPPPPKCLPLLAILGRKECNEIGLWLH